MRLLNSVVALNLPTLRSCMQGADNSVQSKAHAWPFLVSVNRSGRVFHLKLRGKKTSRVRNLDQCVTNVVKTWKFPPTFDKESGKAYVYLAYH